MSLIQVQDERNEWERVNFPTAGLEQAVLGVIEEIGELAHAHLKEQQQIRGSSEEHRVAARDAVGDALIYLMGVCRFSDFYLDEAVRRHRPTGSIDATGALFQCANRVGRLATDNDHFPRLVMRHVGELYWCLAAYCRHRNWDIIEILNETWEGVKKRNWVKNPYDGLTIDEAAQAAAKEGQ